MTYKTLLQIRTKINQDLDLEAETFLSTTAGTREIDGYINAGIDEAEAVIHTIYEDYFLTSYALPFVEGTSTYSLPTDIYANKIRAITYDDGTRAYRIPRIKSWLKFEKFLLLSRQENTSADYQFLIKNVSAILGVQLVLVPTSRVTSNNVATLWYLRNANRLVEETDLCDIPEFTEFVIQFAKVMISKKELNPTLDFEMAALEHQRKLMVDTLTQMVPDDDNTIELDTSIYEEMN